jgi:hypothetical protein
MRKTWILPQTSTPQNNLLNNLGCHPLITQTLIKRGFTDVISARGFLDPTFYSPSPPTEIPHLSRAADRIEVFWSGEISMSTDKRQLHY